ncbi:c-type cytochrome [Dokdonella sp.]|uniref:c-type cytochrome n=1 Tax=Dokdonella sp. TaxID=2291710 RepID=UPI002F3EFDB8
MTVRSLAFTAVIAAIAACSNLPRSRDLANPEVSGRVLAEQVCSNCHGRTGTATSPNFPNLAAQQKRYLITQLEAFRAHSRRDPAGYEYMWGVSRSLTDAQIDALADYYRAQDPPRQPAESPPALVEAGRVLFEHGDTAKGVPACSSCHGANGAGSDAFPRIAGQHADYVRKQLEVFQRTDERPEGAIMKTVAHALSPDDIDAAAAFVQTLE